MKRPKGARLRAGLSHQDVIATVLLTVIVIGLIATAIPKIRHSDRGGSARAKSQNNLKQIGLAVHNYESSYVRMPPLMGGGAGGGFTTAWIPGGSIKNPHIQGPVHVFLLPFVEQDALYKSMYIGTLTADRALTGGKLSAYVTYSSSLMIQPYTQVIPTFISPSDPSHAAGRDEAGWGITSYAANAQVFAKTNLQGLITGELTNTSDQFDRGLPVHEIQDGSSNTILFAEKYGQCGTGGSLWSAGMGAKPITSIPTNTITDPYYWPVFALAHEKGMPNRAYGADPKGAAQSYLMFQSQPNPYTAQKGLANPINAEGCDAFRAGTPYKSGIIVLMGDGSTRSVSATIDPRIWFYSLHPEDGQVVDLD